MPEYCATRFINTREADTYHFTAENDQAAREILLLGDNLDWSGDADLVACDVSDEILALDRRKKDGTYEVIDDEIELAGQMPYGQPSREFVLKVAGIMLFAESDYVTGRPEGTGPEAVQTDLDWLTARDETLESLIREARGLARLKSDVPHAISENGLTPRPTIKIYLSSGVIQDVSCDGAAIVIVHDADNEAEAPDFDPYQPSEYRFPS